MLFSVAEIVSELSRLFELSAGDLIFTGTPSGVGPLIPGDAFRAGFERLLELEGSIAP
jgi:fumarylpyruvate hydrolase